MRDSDDILTQEQFGQLLKRAAEQGKFLPQNAFSFNTLIDAVQREYCHNLKRYLYYKKEYLNSTITKTRNTEWNEKAEEHRQVMIDLLTCLEYLDKAREAGETLEPTVRQVPYSFQQVTQNNVLKQIETMSNPSDSNLLKLRKDMVEYSKEKNRAASSLLGAYAFLNLTAIGLIIYIFRSK